MKKRKALKKGLHLYEGKELSKDFPITSINASSVTVYPLSQHIGAPAEPLVKPGDRVLKGQMIAKAGGFVSAPVHSSVSGTVKSIENRRVVNGSSVKSIVVENDGLDEEVEGMGVKSNPDELSPQELLQKIKDAGIVGLGGAGFPTAVKLSPKNAAEIDTLIINGCECEPYLTVDYRIMLEKGEQIVKAVRQVQRILPNAKAVFGIEDNKNDSIKVIKGFIKSDDNMDICELKTKYPQGAEKQLISAITGRKPAPGTLPWQSGCIVNNIDTCASVFRAVVKGLPVTTRIVTLSGEAIANPSNCRVRIGSPFSYLIEKSGGFKQDAAKVLMGGPMMGTAVPNLSVPVIKGTSGIVAMGNASAKYDEETACIRCAKCVYVCPMNLQPNLLDMAARRDDYDKLEALYISDCIECGSCAYICPSKRRQVQQIKTAKAKLRAAAQAAKA